MKTRITLWIIAITLLIAVGAQAQMPTGQWYVIHSECVKPSMIKDYEAYSLKFVEAVKANRAIMPHFFFAGLQFDDFTYSYAVPIANMAGMDTINQEFGAMMQSPSAADFIKTMTMSNATVDSIREIVVGEAPELSYTPASPRLKPEEEKFFHYDMYYIKAEKAMDVMTVGKDFAEMYKKKNIPDGYKVYFVVVGPDMPAVIVRSAAKDEGDFYMEEAKNRELLGADGKAMFERAFAITRRFDSRNAWLRPDLSAMPPMK